MSKKLSKNQDETRLVNFRLRVSDLERLDVFARTRHISRTRAVENLIETLEGCSHDWVDINGQLSACSICREWRDGVND